MHLNVVVIGGGRYVSGRGTSGFGTVLPALSEWKRSGCNGGDIFCVTTSSNSANMVEQKAKELQAISGVDLDLNVFPQVESPEIQGYLDVLKLVKKPACAIIVIPDHLHHEVAKTCLREGLHVLLVKPMTTTVDDGKDLIKSADRLGLYGAVEFHKRWDRSNLMLRDKFQSGVLGVPLNFLVEYSQKKVVPTEIFKGWSAETNILQYLGIHYIDIVRFVTNALPQRVMAIGQKSFLRDKGIDTYDSIQCAIEWKLQSGFRFTQNVITNWIDSNSSSAHSDQKIKLIGTKGRYEADQKDRGIMLTTDDSGVEHINPDFCMSYKLESDYTGWRGYGIDSFTVFLDDVLALERKKTSLGELNSARPCFREGLISTAVIEAANKSLLKDSNWISVENFE